MPELPRAMAACKELCLAQKETDLSGVGQSWCRQGNDQTHKLFRLVTVIPGLRRSACLYFRVLRAASWAPGSLGWVLARFIVALKDRFHRLVSYGSWGPQAEHPAWEPLGFSAHFCGASGETGPTAHHGADAHGLRLLL